MEGTLGSDLDWVRVHRARNYSLAWLVREALVAVGIEVRIEGESRLALGGEIPLLDAMVDLRVPPAQAKRAREVLDRVERAGEGAAWVCARCGEENPPNFELCWGCRGERAVPGGP